MFDFNNFQAAQLHPNVHACQYACRLSVCATYDTTKRKQSIKNVNSMRTDEEKIIKFL